jgi:hypothetical protein
MGSFSLRFPTIIWLDELFSVLYALTVALWRRVVYPYVYHESCFMTSFGIVTLVFVIRCRRTCPVRPGTAAVPGVLVVPEYA